MKYRFKMWIIFIFAYIDPQIFYFSYLILNDIYIFWYSVEKLFLYIDFVFWQFNESVC